MREIRRQGQGAPVVVAGPFRSVERSGRDVVRELLDGSRNSAPGSCAVVIAGGGELIRADVIAQANIVENALHRLDGRVAAREQATRLLAEFEALLASPEEPCHQFVKTHPNLLCTTYDAAWSKVPFGEHVSDFVFRQPCNDYLLVEIEAPYRELFRKNGHQRRELTHAIGQIDDWLCYIQDNKIP